MLMLSYAPVGAGTPNRNVDPDLKKLQEALKKVYSATGNSAFDPGAVDGIAGEKTLNAVLAVLPKLGGILDSRVAAALEIAITSYAIFEPEKAIKKIKEKAEVLTGAVLAYNAKLIYDRTQAARGGGTSTGTSTGITQTTFVLPTRTGGGGMTFTPPPPPAVIAQPWYKQTWGMAAIGVGAVGFLSLLVILTRR